MQDFDMYVTKIIGDLTYKIESYSYLEPLFVLISGFLTSFLPCTLTMIPVVIMYLNRRTKKEGKHSGFIRKHMLHVTLPLTLGMMFSFTSLGIIIAFTSNVLQLFLYSNWVYILIGVISILVSLQMFGILKVNLNMDSTKFIVFKNKYVPFQLGMLIGVLSSPCSTPMLIMILNKVALDGNLASGAFDLALYGLGHGVVFILIGVGLKMKDTMFTKSHIYGIIGILLNSLFALLSFLIGVYLLYKGL